jgi:hypothetical protein
MQDRSGGLCHRLVDDGSDQFNLVGTLVDRAGKEAGHPLSAVVGMTKR